MAEVVEVIGRSYDRHFRVVNIETGGIAYSAAASDHGRWNARFNAEGWLERLGDGYRIEEWEQMTPVVESTWRRVNPPEDEDQHFAAEDAP